MVRRAAWRGAAVAGRLDVAFLVAAAVIVPATRLERRLVIDVAVEVFVDIVGIRGRIAGVRGRELDVRRAVVARGAVFSAPQAPVVSALYRLIARGAVAVVKGALLRRREALESHRPKELALPLTPDRRAIFFLTTFAPVVRAAIIVTSRRGALALGHGSGVEPVGLAAPAVVLRVELAD